MPSENKFAVGYIPLACRELIARLDTLFLGENLVTQHVTQHANDKLEVEPTLKALEQLPETLGKAEALLADTGHRSESNTKACDAAKITPYIAGAREDHHPPVEARFTEPPALAPDANVVEAMDHRLATVEGRAIYALRKSTVEPVYGIIKSALGFRQFHLRGLHSASGEWTLVTIAWNLKPLFNLRCAAARTAAAACLKASDTSPKHSIFARRQIQKLIKTRLYPNASSSFLPHVFAFCDFKLFAVELTPTGC